MSASRTAYQFDPDSHFAQLAEWLAMESEAELVRMAERRKNQNAAHAEKSGETILDLQVTEDSYGLGGMLLLTFGRRNGALPWHRLKVGSPVVITACPEGDDSKAVSGVVSGRTQRSLQVAVNQWPEGDRFRIDLTADEVTRQRQMAALVKVSEGKGRLRQLRQITMGQRKPAFQTEVAPVGSWHAHLNDSQKEAVEFALSAYDLAVIHGPPGTGKTTTVVELIIQAILRGEKVLACAPSNTAVDNLLERLIAAGQKVVRIGHPARVSEALRDYTLDGIVETHESMKVVKEMVREAEQIFRQAGKWTRAKRVRGQRQEMRGDARRLMSDAKLLEAQVVQWVLDKADVICATSTFNEDLLGDRWFDLVVIDEACQTTEPGCWVPLLRCQKVVLAGDHQQLPPTVLSSEAAQQGFAVSLMERQLGLHGEAISRQLKVQYRMHQQIMDFSSREFYDGHLVADDSVARHRLCDLRDVEPSELTTEPVMFVDTAGANWDEEKEPEGRSRRNPREAEWVVRKISQLRSAGLSADQISVIAPYAAQVRLIRDLDGGSGVEIDTVDGFQGRENEAVIISLVRSNDRGEIGFLGDRRRMNVALTRARRKLIVIGDSSTLGGDPFYGDLLDYIHSIHAYHSVWTEDLE